MYSSHPPHHNHLPHPNPNSQSRDGPWGRHNGTMNQGERCVLHLRNLNEERVTPDVIFMLVGVYADVHRVKIMFNQKSAALVEVSNRLQADNAINYLDNVPLFGNNLRVQLSKFNEIKGGRRRNGVKRNNSTATVAPETSTDTAIATDTDTMGETNNNSGEVEANSDNTNIPEVEEMSEDNKAALLLNGDYIDNPLHRYRVFGSRNYSNITSPSSTLHLSNLPVNWSEVQIKAMFKPYATVDAIKLFAENKGKRMCLIRFNSLDEATTVIVLCHNMKMDERHHLRVCFSKSEIKNT